MGASSLEEPEDTQKRSAEAKKGEAEAAACEGEDGDEEPEGHDHAGPRDPLSSSAVSSKLVVLVRRREKPAVQNTRVDRPRGPGPIELLLGHYWAIIELVLG